MGLRDNKSLIPLIIGISFLLVIVLIEYFSIIHLNNGKMVYTLDDPYIHLALAQHILNGHYGINSSQFSAPSSTILWPFILAPFSSNVYFPLLLNVAAAILTVYIFYKILIVSYNIKQKKANNIVISFFLILLILSTNIMGLIFTGMEHSLQVLAVLIIAYGLIVEIESNKVKSWLLISIVIAPLIRYENLAVSIPAICYLAVNKYYKEAISLIIIIIILLGGFSLFLISLGLYPIPTSILVKSPIMENSNKFTVAVHNLFNTFSYRQGKVLFLGLLILSSLVFFTKKSKKRKLALITIAGIILHFIAGEYDWFNRYEIYILSFSLLVIIYISGEIIMKLLEKGNQNLKFILLLIIAVFAARVVGYKYIMDLFLIPTASNNIYEQQYQMHRFIVDYYKKPVGVNDIGYVSYNNKNYVLDLWGLASIKALKDRLKDNNPDWMEKLVKEKDVKLAMIYDRWFKNIPGDWIKIGALHLGKKRITPAQSAVSFYATGPKEYFKILNELKLFIKTLPPDTKFTFNRVKDFYEKGGEINDSVKRGGRRS